MKPATHTPGPWWLRAENGCVHVGGPTIDKQIALVMTCDAVGVANARLISRAPEMLATLRRAVPWLGTMIADGGHLGCVGPNDCVATLRQAEDLIAFVIGAEATTQPRPDPLDVLRDLLDWYAHSTDADGDMPPELHARLIRAVGGEVAADGEATP